MQEDRRKYLEKKLDFEISTAKESMELRKCEIDIKNRELVLKEKEIDNRFELEKKKIENDLELKKYELELKYKQIVP